MKHVLLLLFATILITNSYAQIGLTFKQAHEKGISTAHLDSIYKSGIHANPELGIFNDKYDEYVEDYKSMLQSLNKFLMANEFYWEKTTRCFNRIYFNKDGGIDYFLYNFNAGQLTEEQEATFEKLLNEFIKTYTFPLTADTGFAQCSPVNYQPTKAE